MPNLIKRLRNWGTRCGNVGWSGSVCVQIFCFMSLFLLHAVSVQAEISVSPQSAPVYSNLNSGPMFLDIHATASDERYETQVIEKWMPTSSWLDIRLIIPQNDLKDENGNPGKFYVLIEHPRLLPEMTYAYRCLKRPGCSPTECGQDTDCQLDLFSQSGHLVTDAASLCYQSDREWDLQWDVLSIPFGGFRLIGLEGDIIIHCMVGTPRPGNDWGMTRLLRYTIHIVPLTGIWIVTDDAFGQTYTYPEPLVLYESRGQIEGSWMDVRFGSLDPVNRVDYVNPSDALPDHPEIVGTRIQVVNADVVSGYDIHFTEWSTTQKKELEYWYQITDLNQGGMRGYWRYRDIGQELWSIPLSFSAVLQSVIIPLDPLYNCYFVNGTVNGFSTEFIVDTGAAMVFLSAADAPSMGVNLTDPVQCPFTGTAIGVGGEVPITYCYVDILIGGSIFREDVITAFSEDWTGPGLLGMTFLDRCHISTNAADGTMIIAP